MLNVDMNSTTVNRETYRIKTPCAAHEVVKMIEVASAHRTNKIKSGGGAIKADEVELRAGDYEVVVIWEWTQSNGN